MASLAPTRTGPFSRTLVVTASGVPIAAGSVVASTLHPTRLWSYIEVAADHRRQGIGTALMDALREVAAANGQTTALRVKLAPFSDGEGVRAGDRHEADSAFPHGARGTGSDSSGVFA